MPGLDQQRQLEALTRVFLDPKRRNDVRVTKPIARVLEYEQLFAGDYFSERQSLSIRRLDASNVESDHAVIEVEGTEHRIARENPFGVEDSEREVEVSVHYQREGALWRVTDLVWQGHSLVDHTVIDPDGGVHIEGLVVRCAAVVSGHRETRVFLEFDNAAGEDVDLSGGSLQMRRRPWRTDAQFRLGNDTATAGGKTLTYLWTPKSFGAANFIRVRFSGRGRSTQRNFKFDFEVPLSSGSLLPRNAKVVTREQQRWNRITFIALGAVAVIILIVVALIR